MANLKQAKKRAKQNLVRRKKNKTRESEIKTLTKKFYDALSTNDFATAQDLARLAESKIARAKGKHVLQKNTASRKISRMAKRLQAATAKA